MARSPRAAAILERLEEVEALDPVGKVVGKKVRQLIPGGAVKDALSGVWLGHALHPVIAYGPLGTWMSAVALDWLGGDEDSADLLVALGLAGTIPAAVTGVSDWADSEVGDPRQRRVGLIHAASNYTALALMAASLVQRRRGNRGRGKLLGLAGASAVGVGGWLGGHLAYGQGVGVDQTAFLEPVEEWTPVELPEGGPVTEGGLTHGRVGTLDLVLTRRDGRVLALAGRCCHRGGPLHEGRLEDGCVVCPWHFSRFEFADGSVRRGPAAYPQPAFAVRETADGGLEARSKI